MLPGIIAKMTQSHGLTRCAALALAASGVRACNQTFGHTMGQRGHSPPCPMLRLR